MYKESIRIYGMYYDIWIPYIYIWMYYVCTVVDIPPIMMCVDIR